MLTHCRSEPVSSPFDEFTAVDDDLLGERLSPPYEGAVDVGARRRAGTHRHRGMASGPTRGGVGGDEHWNFAAAGHPAAGTAPKYKRSWQRTGSTGTNRVEAGTDVDNLAGFRREGVVGGAQWRSGTWRDLVIYSRLRAADAGLT
jgi:hypothetical protein